MRSSLLLLLGLVLLGLPTRGGAQTAEEPAHLIVEVEALEDGALLADVQIAVGRAGIGGVTDALGRAVIRDIPPGVHFVTLRVLGFAAEAFAVDFTPGAVMKAEVKLASRPEPASEAEIGEVALGEVEVTAERDSRWLARGGFYERRARGLGTFLSRADLDARQPVVLSDALRTVPGVRILPDGLATSVTSSRGTHRPGACVMAVFVDGVFAAQPDLDAIPPETVEALEVYRGPSELPPQFNSASLDATCGAIVVWTRIDTAPSEAP